MMRISSNLAVLSFSRAREKAALAKRGSDEGGAGPHPSRLRRAALSRERERGIGSVVSALFFATSLLLGAPALAISPDEMLADPKLESRARAIASELRCLVCQNQSIDDSDAPLAKDLRVLVREKLKEGASDADVRAFVVARYGDFVLLRPPVKPQTLLLWTAPLLALIGGAAAIYLAARRGRRGGGALTEAERAQLQALGVSVDARADVTTNPDGPAPSA
jgi:cytochrome c-type biogenesis protein CcmH